MFDNSLKMNAFMRISSLTFPDWPGSVMGPSETNLTLARSPPNDEVLLLLLFMALSEGELLIWWSGRLLEASLAIFRTSFMFNDSQTPERSSSARYLMQYCNYSVRHAYVMCFYGIFGQIDEWKAQPFGSTYGISIARLNTGLIHL